MFMSVFTNPARVERTGLCALSWTALPDIGDGHPAGRVVQGVLADADVVFVLNRRAPQQARVTQGFDWPAGPALMRVDEVCFPVGAVAHRHTHAGAGFRHLVRGALRIEAGGAPKIMEPQMNWFEPEDTPVRAVALQASGVTSFVRCMIVPPEYEGKSTFQLVDPSDGDLPRLQVTHRHMDCPVQVDAG